MEQLFWIVFGVSGWVTCAIVYHMFFCDVIEMNDRWMNLVDEMNAGWNDVLEQVIPKPLETAADTDNE